MVQNEYDGGRESIRKEEIIEEGRVEGKGNTVISVYVQFYFSPFLLLLYTDIIK